MYPFRVRAPKSKSGYRTISLVIISAILLGILSLCHGLSEITGKVIDKETGDPISGAVVTIESDVGILDEFITKQDGTFQFSHATQNGQH